MRPKDGSGHHLSGLASPAGGAASPGGGASSTTAVRTATVVGAGLVGASVALALAAQGVEVLLDDREPAVAQSAERMGAGVVRGNPQGRSDLVVVAVPASATVEVLLAEQQADTGRIYTDVASVKRVVIDAAERAGVDMSTFVPGHPMAGGHTSGPGGASADLFVGRTWVLTPTAATDESAVETLTRVLVDIGARPRRMAHRLHDRAVALSSHVPHLVASGLASLYAREADPDTIDLCGRGVEDATRIAAGDVDLWRDIVRSNADHIERPLREVATRLLAVADHLRSPKEGFGDDVLNVVLERGAHGQARLSAARPPDVPDDELPSAA